MTTPREAIARALCTNKDQPCDYCFQTADKALAAIEAVGWQLIPKRPTSDMLEAFDKGGLFTWHKFTKRYAKLLAAAPKPGGMV